MKHMEDTNMKERLQQLIKNASTPYYHFSVACIVECKDGNLFEGVNVETSSPASGSCAERVALFSAIAHGYHKGDFKTLYLYNTTEQNIFPCFICRQALMDYCDLDTKIVSYNSQGETIEVSIKDLCPYPFDEEAFK